MASPQARRPSTLLSMLLLLVLVLHLPTLSALPTRHPTILLSQQSFPGSITVCRKDNYEDCTTLIEAPGSVSRRCTRVPMEFNDRISSLVVQNGCCEFHRAFDCQGGRLLVVCNERSRGSLFGITNNQISSWRCYFGDR